MEREELCSSVVVKLPKTMHIRVTPWLAVLPETDFCFLTAITLQHGSNILTFFYHMPQTTATILSKRLLQPIPACQDSPDDITLTGAGALFFRLDKVLLEPQRTLNNCFHGQRRVERILLCWTLILPCSVLHVWRSSFHTTATADLSFSRHQQKEPRTLLNRRYPAASVSKVLVNVWMSQCVNWAGRYLLTFLTWTWRQTGGTKHVKMKQCQFHNDANQNIYRLSSTWQLLKKRCWNKCRSCSSLNDGRFEGQWFQLIRGRTRFGY